jgi:AcrR family transcriptional regulator
MESATLTIAKPGRPRSDDATAAILQATLSLLEKTCYQELSIEAIAEAAGVGKPTIYRRWKTKAAIVAEAFIGHAQVRVPAVDSGSFEGDLRIMLTNLADRLENSSDGKILRGLISEANLDASSGEAFRQYVESRRSLMRAIVVRARERREICTAVADEDVIDEIYGALIYRYMVRREPLDQAFVHRHIDLILRAVRPGTS